MEEQEIARAAHRAGRAMLNEWRGDLADKNPERWLVPVLAHMAGVELVGIFRMRYRPRTRSTAAWFARKQDWETWTSKYDGLAREAGAVEQSRNDAAG
jgi:hypothetical protein